jgi:hypothetical protein
MEICVMVVKSYGLPLLAVMAIFAGGNFSLIMRIVFLMAIITDPGRFPVTLSGGMAFLTSSSAVFALERKVTEFMIEVCRIEACNRCFTPQMFAVTIHALVCL